MPTKHSASLIAAMARGEMWALHTVRSTEVMGSPATTPTAAYQQPPQQQQQQQQLQHQPQSGEVPGAGGVPGSGELLESSSGKAERIDK
ncbi:hypothetical protein LTR35_014445 [Friedmanniomyces endolithicus]|uniref:Uncharacterized protein n=1 Tax=Friedmanniomyces endolithicus TaxID=329885 RepID=A0AAN6FD42_9PEZI|nr:hypothetical protein LTR35_014445 [Friedmanniomyces endolithicus]KAK0279313.1 hypothetical protein LTS00_013418 [Friedmanniomyces endolithicus]KAK0312432.1 hypothetical protein LTR82_013902 [Friedmanniomyces endolithicus]KAK0988731.1 hypothetical protein LTR54_012691 [Friedmanniomyces endolithicus]